MNDQPMPEAGPSTPQPAIKKESRRAKRAREGQQAGRPNGTPSQPQAGPSSTPAVEASRLARKNEKKQKKAVAATKSKGDEWECVPISRGAVSKVPPVWSADARFYFTVANTSIHIHSSSPPAFERLSTIGGGNGGHSKNITALLLHPTNPMQIITAAEDGTVKIWDWVEGRLVRTLVLADGGKVLHIALGLVGGKWVVFANIGMPKQSQDSSKSGYHMNFRIMRMALSPPAAGSYSIAYHVGKLSYTPTGLIISPRFTYLVALSANKAYTYRLPVNPTQIAWKPSCVKFVSDQHFTCGAFAPEKVIGGRSDEEWFATGDVKGVIRLWHGLTSAFSQIDAVAASQQGVTDPAKAVLPDTEKRLPTTSLHWHAHAVSAIAFTPSGAQLLSVGEESVLVQWHLASGKREYIPRLGGRPIVTLAVKTGGRGVEEEWWVKMEDGGVARIGSSSGQITTVGQDVRLDPLRPKDLKTAYPMAIHPPTRALVLPSSHSSTLQFVDPQSSSVLFDLEIAPSNRVSRRDDKEHEPVSVERVAFSDHTEGSNRWMATVEGRKGDEAEGGGLVKTLKFWRWVDDKYRISTQIPRPHGSSDIVKIAFSPSRPDDSSSQAYLLTAASDGTAKLWHVRSAKRPEQGKGKKKPVEAELFWSTRSTFTYRSLPIHDVVFAPDSTLIAFAHGSVVTLWDVEKNILLKALEGGVTDVRQFGFIGEDGRYLVTAGSLRGIAVWDLLSCEVTWSSSASSCFRLIAVPHHPFFIAVHEVVKADHGTRFSVFGVKNANPLRSVKATNKLSRVVLLPSLGASSVRELRFAGVAYSGEITRFGDDVARDVVVGANAIRSSGTKTVSIWQEMFGQDAFLEAEGTTHEIAPRHDVVKKSSNPVDIFEGPSHTLPPVSLLFDAFLEQILVPKSSAVEGSAEETILYEEEEEVVPTYLVNRNPVREVRDEEVEELEHFFRDMLKTGSGPVERKLPNGHAHNKVNGKALPNGTPTKIGQSPKKSPKDKKNKQKKPTGEKDETDGDEVVVAGTPGGTSRRKKRKAPREEGTD